MAEVVYGVAVSLDGFIAPTDGGVGWLEPFSAAGREHAGEFLATVGAILVGSRTYEQVREFGGTGMFGRPWYVFSSRRLPADGPGVTVTAASPADVVAELDRRGVARAWLFGGARLFESFRAAGLVTGYSLGLVPVVLGGGVPLFASPGPPQRLRLEASRAHPTGALFLRYGVARD